MTTFNTTTTVIGVILFLIILILVRRGQLQEKYSLAWFTIGIAVVVLGIFPKLVDRIGVLSGIHYPPILLLVIAVGVLLVLNLHLFILTSRNEVRIQKLLQQVAVLEKLVAESIDDANPMADERKGSDPK